MKNLINKELKLCIHPMCYFFSCLGLLLLIPNYPYFLSFMYCLFADMFVFPMANENNDILYMASLPIRKSEMVKARVLSFVLIQAVCVIVCIISAVVSNIIYPTGNSVGINANLAFFGFGLLSIGIHNVIAIPGYYKTAHKFIKPVFLGIIGATIFGLLTTAVLPYIPGCEELFDNWTNIPVQAIVLAVGIIGYILSIIFSIKWGTRNLEKVDL